MSQKKCKGCGEPLEFVLRGKLKVYIQENGCHKNQQCKTNWLISDDPKAKIYLDKLLEKNKKEFQKSIKKNWKEKKIELKDKVKTLSQYESEAKKEFQKFIRNRDADLPCISCNTIKDVQYAGGHYFKAEIYSGLIFDERNCHKQCNAHCNKFKDGAQAEYRIGLVNRYGKVFVEELENDSIEKRYYKYTKQELIDIKNYYKKLNKEFEITKLNN